jgi:pullulanase/glycogen debranching enzyme
MDFSSIKHSTSAPLGPTVYPDGVNFSVFARDATAVELLLFEDERAPQPSRIISLDPNIDRSYHYWHVLVRGLVAGQVYAYRAKGPFDPRRGYRFDGEKVLLDPYGLGVAVPETYDRAAGARRGSNSAVALKSVVIDPSAYDWEGDTPLQRPYSETIVYELHVGGFTRHPNSGVAAGRRGTYAGLIEKIPYLQALGITAVELLPVFQFDPQDASPGHVNYWGYQPGFVLRTTPRLQLAQRRAGDARRRERRTDPLLSRSRERLLLHSGGRQIALRRLLRLREHAECESADRPPIDPGQPALLGDPDARRRVSFRSRRHPVARRARPAAA